MRIGSSTIFREGNTPVPVLVAVSDDNVHGLQIIKNPILERHGAFEVMPAREQASGKPYLEMG